MRRVREPWPFKVPPVCQQWYCSLRKTKHEISVLLLKLLTFDLYSFICSTTAIFICYMCLSCGLCGNLQHGVDHTCTVNRKWLIYRKYLNQGLIVIMILKKRKLNMGHIFVTTRNLRFVLRVLKPRRLNTDTLCSPPNPTSGSRISITWLSDAFLTKQKADPDCWDGDRAGGRKVGVTSPDTFTLTEIEAVLTLRGGKDNGLWSLWPASGLSVLTH